MLQMYIRKCFICCFQCRGDTLLFFRGQNCRSVFAPQLQQGCIQRKANAPDRYLDYDRELCIYLPCRRRNGHLTASLQLVIFFQRTRLRLNPSPVTTGRTASSVQRPACLRESRRWPSTVYLPAVGGRTDFQQRHDKFCAVGTFRSPPMQKYHEQQKDTARFSSRSFALGQSL